MEEAPPPPLPEEPVMPALSTEAAASPSVMKRYAVVPLESLLHQLQQQQATHPHVQRVQQEIATTSSLDLANLDSQLKSIIESRTSYPDVNAKVKALKQVLSRFLQVGRQQRAPFKTPPSQDAAVATLADDVEQVQKSPYVLAEIEAAVGFALKSRARSLFSNLLRIPELGWNERNELVINGKTIPHSNIVTLMIDAVKQPRKGISAPLGWSRFGQLLVEHNVSDHYIGNKDRYLYPFQPIEVLREQASQLMQSARTQKRKIARQVHAQTRSKSAKALRRRLAGLDSGHRSAEDDDDDEIEELEEEPVFAAAGDADKGTSSMTPGHQRRDTYISTADQMQMAFDPSVDSASFLRPLEQPRQQASSRTTLDPQLQVDMDSWLSAQRPRKKK